LQLIEIVQIALLLFIALSAIIFLFSYLGYRTKSKTNVLSKTSTVNIKPEIKQSKVVDSGNPQQKNDTPKNPINKNPRFEVFTPDKDEKIESEKSFKKKSHYPKTLTIKHKSNLN
jgi:hypothetical protein